jgi:co-chaperonin GroES (HSP10)
MILGKGMLPAQPRGHRMMCKPNPPKTESDCGIIIPDTAQILPVIGVIIHAGLNARDAMYDHGDEIGDTVWWGKFAGVMEEWDRIVEDGNKKGCDHDTWNRLPSPGKNVHRFECTACKAVRQVDPLVVINHDDILCNVTAERRRDSGVYSIARGKTSSGTTQHFIDRKDK